MYASHFVAPPASLSTRKCRFAVRFSFRLLIKRQTFQHARNIWLHKATALYETLTRARWKKEISKNSDFPHTTESDDIDLSQRRVRVEEGTYKLSFRWRESFFFPPSVSRKMGWGREKCNKGDFMRNIKKQKKKESQYLWTSPTHAREKFSFAFALFLLHPRPYRKNIKHKIRSL